MASLLDTYRPKSLDYFLALCRLISSQGGDIGEFGPSTLQERTKRLPPTLHRAKRFASRPPSHWAPMPIGHVYWCDRRTPLIPHELGSNHYVRPFRLLQTIPLEGSRVRRRRILRRTGASCLVRFLTHQVLLLFNSAHRV